MFVYKILLLLILIILSQSMTPEEASDAIETILKKNCGEDFINSQGTYCNQVDPYDAAAMLGILCTQN